MIRVLDKQVADKIAAGEVVERPVSIIKELIENSIDAGSDKITIEIKKGGKEYIRVSDNGCGIKKDEVEIAFMRHGTSKIATVSDLEAINTLGFRGEALASICAVSRVEILTKSIDESIGSKSLIYGSNIIESKPFGAPQGTTIVVRDLFYNTPARLKFLGSDKAESSAIIQLVSNLAMAFTNIKFILINNDKILFSTRGDGDLLKVIQTITSGIETQNLVPLDYEENHIKVYGYTSKPSFSKASRKNQIYFVNGRNIKSKVIEKGIDQGYDERLFEGRFPITYLFLEIDPYNLDVNIHPNKREVKFYREDLVVETIRKAIVESLNKQQSIGSIEKIEEYKKDVILNDIIEKVDTKYNYDTYKKTDEIQEEKKSIDQFRDEFEVIDDFEKFTLKKEREERKEKEIQEEIFEKNNRVFDFTKLRIGKQVFNTYIELYDDESIYFLDQHAGHERVFFEMFVREYEKNSLDKQMIFTPFIQSVSNDVKEVENTWLPIVGRIGYELEEFGHNLYRVVAIPTIFGVKEAEEFLNDFLDTFDEFGDYDNKKTLDKIATKACKAAIKGNNHLDDKEIRALLEEMSDCQNPYSCPHGRPTFIKIDKKELEKRFKRI